MSETSALLLAGVGGAGCAMVRGIVRAAGDPAPRHVLADTDASSAAPGSPFALLGGDRLSGRGSGGDVVQARLAAEDSMQAFDEHLEGVRLAVVVTALGGGTGGGATLEICKRLAKRGVASVVFATLPFAFEGENRLRKARGVVSMIAEAANAAVFQRLDALVAGEREMDAAMKRAIDVLAAGVALFWRLLSKPGYIRLDAERLRKIVSAAGRGRFAAATARGETRAREIVDALAASPLLSAPAAPAKSILCGVLAGSDLRLAEVGEIAEGVRDAFGRRAAFDLATVNDDESFSGRISAVAMLFEGERSADAASAGAAGRRGRKDRNPLAPGPQGRGRFNNVEPTVWNGEDLDVPAYARRNISLDI